MPRSLADGRTKFTILVVEPVNPEAPTAAELNAGIDASCNILQSDFNWTATDSEKVAEKALCDQNNSNAIGAGNYNVGFTVWRYFDATTLDADAVADAVFDAVRAKGTEFWGYARETAKESTADWVAGDEIYLAGRVLSDNPQRPENGGFIKRRIPLEMQSAYDDIVVAAGA